MKEPRKANNPTIAARVLAACIASKKIAIKYALYGGDLRYARRVVNGGSHGLDRFVEAFKRGRELLSPETTPSAIRARSPQVPTLTPATGAPMTIVVNRFTSDVDTSISSILVDGAFQCFGLEDEFREVKVAGETRIPAGDYEVRLRREGGFHERYRTRYGAMHRGMLHIQDVPGFTFILIHCGNTDEDTKGCLLVGTDAITRSGEMRVTSSRAAYEKLYPRVVDAAEQGRLRIRFEDNDRAGV